MSTVPPPVTDRLLERFIGDTAAAMGHLPRFLTPHRPSQVVSSADAGASLGVQPVREDDPHEDQTTQTRLPALRRHRLLLCLLATAMATILAACSPLPPKMAMKAGWKASPNFDGRRPNLVIIHHTGNSTLAQALHTLTSPERKVSSHYLIGRDGEVFQLVEENARAWHAGQSWWGGFTDVNSVSLGIELDNNGREPFADAQIEALLTLLADIRERYKIPRANFIGHADVAPTRKDDPSAWFPWQRLAERGFGLWCEAPLPPAPVGFDLALALTAIGYDPRTPEASRKAFRLHFVRTDLTLSAEHENALAFCLLQQKRSPGQ